MAQNVNHIRKRLWATADQLWENTGLKPAEFSTPVLGLIFLRYAEKRYSETERRIGPFGSGERRRVSKAEFHAKGMIVLPPEARFSRLETIPEGDGLPDVIAWRDASLGRGCSA